MCRNITIDGAWDVTINIKIYNYLSLVYAFNCHETALSK